MNPEYRNVLNSEALTAEFFDKKEILYEIILYVRYSWLPWGV